MWDSAVPRDRPQRPPRRLVGLGPGRHVLGGALRLRDALCHTPSGEKAECRGSFSGGGRETPEIAEPLEASSSHVDLQAPRCIGMLWPASPRTQPLRNSAGSYHAALLVWAFLALCPISASPHTHTGFAPLFGTVCLPSRLHWFGHPSAPDVEEPAGKLNARMGVDVLVPGASVHARVWYSRRMIHLRGRSLAIAVGLAGRGARLGEVGDVGRAHLVGYSSRQPNNTSQHHYHH